METNNIFTAFCRKASANSTTWIQIIEVPSEPQGNLIMRAGQVAKQKCAKDWGQQIENIHCLGLVRGKIEVAYWGDLVEVVA